mmetsp:Transcript_126213/g.218648  ORF Transcript_126213/g.218648 Transcript_126213/m.218648 type:complete len:94 (+) Transcript_126213:222-503(+)
MDRRGVQGPTQCQSACPTDGRKTGIQGLLLLGMLTGHPWAGLPRFSALERMPLGPQGSRTKPTNHYQIGVLSSFTLKHISRNFSTPFTPSTSH